MPSDQVLSEANKTATRGIMSYSQTQPQIAALSDQINTPSPPQCAMIHSQTGHDPPSAGHIQGKGKLRYGFSVDFIVEEKEDAEASVCKNGM